MKEANERTDERREGERKEAGVEKGLGREQVTGGWAAERNEDEGEKVWFRKRERKGRDMRTKDKIKNKVGSKERTGESGK